MSEAVLELESGSAAEPEVGVKKYVVRLSEDERATLAAVVSKGKRPAREIVKARILLKADVSEAGDGWSDERIAQALDTSLSTIYRTRQRLVEDGLDAALRRKPREQASHDGWPVKRHFLILPGLHDAGVDLAETPT
jgi:hypothetical protein